jgi:hypothetical protein
MRFSLALCRCSGASAELMQCALASQKGGVGDSTCEHRIPILKLTNRTNSRCIRTPHSRVRFAFTHSLASASFIMTCPMSDRVLHPANRPSSPTRAAEDEPLPPQFSAGDWRGARSVGIVVITLEAQKL